MKIKQLSKITALVFAVFIALGPACAIVAANGEAEQPTSQTAPQNTPQIQPVQQTTQSTQQPAASGNMTLDQAIKEAANQIDERFKAGSKIAPLNFSSPSDNFSSYVLDELTANLVDSRKLIVVDRKEIDLIRDEFKFQFSGEVGDDSMQALGRMLGAQSIISGSLTDMGGFYRIVIRVLNVQNASVEVQYRANIANDTVVAALLNGGRTNRTTTSGSSGTTSNRTSGVTISADTVPDGAIVLNVNNVATWNTAVNKIRNGGNGETYVISVTGNVLVPVVAENLFGSVTGITVTIQGGGTLSISNTQGSLLRIGTRQTIIARNIILKGRSGNNSAVVVIESGGTFRMENGASVTGNICNDAGYSGVLVNGGTFTMQGGTISGNIAGWEGGGGVSVKSGTFTMQGGTISGNSNKSWQGFGNGGGGVSVNGGTFTMQGGTISGNSSNIGYGDGGGVFVDGGTFIMQGGTISDNVANKRYGGGVYVNKGTFTKTGGTIQGNDEPNHQNSAKEQGHAVYLDSYPNRWRNATAGPDDNTAGYGFWLND